MGMILKRIVCYFLTDLEFGKSHRNYRKQFPTIQITNVIKFILSLCTI